MGRCKDCKYFKRHEKEWETTTFGDCKCDKFIYDTWGASENSATDLVYYWDGEGYTADFEVGENFGCVHFENLAKNNKT